MYPYFSKKNDEIKSANYEKSNSSNTENNINDQEEFENYVLDLIENAAQQENYDMRYFEDLSNIVPDDESKELLRRIHLEDMKHYNMLHDLYCELANCEPNIECEEIDIDCDDLPSEFLKCSDQKYNNIELYRNIMTSFLDIPIRDMLFEIITDEQAHAQKLLYLYNKCKH